MAGYNKTLNDTLTPTDAVSKAIPRILTIWGLLALSSPYQQRNLQLSDGVTVNEGTLSRLLSRVATFLDNVFVTDRTTKAISHAFGELAITFTETFTTLRAKVLRLIDSFSIRDAASSVLQRVASFMDSLTINDRFINTVVRVVDAVRTFVSEIWNRLWHVIPPTRTWTVETTQIRNWSAKEIMLNTSKDPNANEAFSFDWSSLVMADNITASSWSCDSGIVLSNDSFTSTTTTVRIGGGSLDRVYNVYNKVTLQSGQVKVQALAVTISNA